MITTATEATITMATIFGKSNNDNKTELFLAKVNHIYIYIYLSVCLCVCVSFSLSVFLWVKIFASTQELSQSAAPK